MQYHSVGARRHACDAQEQGSIVVDEHRRSSIVPAHTCSCFCYRAAPFRLGGASSSTMSSRDEVVGGGSDDSSVVGGGEVAAPRSAQRRRSRAVPTRPFLLACDDEQGFWKDHKEVTTNDPTSWAWS